ncbi:cholesterol oxidase [Fragilaria crotonensis]|nr:cholesterol oxidase [Fragilaria crotonensis]
MRPMLPTQPMQPTQPSHQRRPFGSLVGNWTGVHLNRNGLIDRLDVELDVETNTSGSYSFSAALKNKDNTEVGYYNSSAVLTKGVNNLTFQFSGQRIGSSGIQGPFYLRDLHVWGDSSLPSLLLPDPAFEMIPLNASQFEGYIPFVPAIRLVTEGGNSTGNSTGVDSNQNRFYDRLDVEIKIETNVPGVYSWFATLNDKNSTEVGFCVRSAAFTIGINLLKCTFNGRPIGANGVDGPFFVSNLFVWGVGQTPLVLDGPVFKTIALKASQFEGYTPTTSVPSIIPAIQITGKTSSTGVHLNQDGFYDRLDVAIEIETFSSGSYSWLATLNDKTYTEIGFFVNSAVFTAGINRLTFEFRGRPIGANGVDGPFFISNLFVWGDNQPSLVRSGPVIETIALKANQFGGQTIGSNGVSGPFVVSNLIVWLDGQPSLVVSGRAYETIALSAIALCANVDVVADASTCSVASASINNGSTDPDLVSGDNVTIVQTPPGPYTLGKTLVVLTVTDSKGLTASCNSTVTVVDATPPIVTCNTNRKNDAASHHYDVSYTVTDACDTSPTVTSTTVACHGQYQFVSVGQTLGISFDCNDTFSGQAVVPDSIVVTATDKAGKVGSCSKVLQDSTTPNTPNPTTKKPSSPATNPPTYNPKIIPRPSTKPMMMMMNMMAYRRPYAVPRGKHGLRGGTLISFQRDSLQPQGHEHGTTRGMM